MDQKGGGTVTGNKCDNGLLFIKLKNLTKGM